MEISVIIPVYNVVDYIGKCLESLIRLDERIKEIICVDNGSDDGSEKVIEKFAQEDLRIKLITISERGVCIARNTGMKQARGEYLIFVDSDDYIIPEKFHKMLDEVERLETIDAVWTGYVREDWSGRHEENTTLIKGYLEEDCIKKQFIPAILGISYEKLYAWFKGEQVLNEKQEFPTVWRGLYSKKIIEKNNIEFNEKMKTGEDILFNLLYYSKVKSMWVTDCNYYCYVWRVGSLTQDNSQNFLQAKSIFVVERDKLSYAIEMKDNINYSKEYQGSLVLTKIQMALSLSNCKIVHFFNQYIAFKGYVSYKGIIKAYKNLKLKDAPLKYKIVFSIAKYNLNFILFMGCFILNKLKIHIYPDE